LKLLIVAVCRFYSYVSSHFTKKPEYLTTTHEDLVSHPPRAATTAGGLINVRRDHVALDGWIEQHSCDVVTPAKVLSIMRETPLVGGVWKWTGRAFVPVPRDVALKRLTRRLRDVQRRRRQEKPHHQNHQQRPVVKQSFQMRLVPPDNNVKRPTRTAANIVHHHPTTASLLPDDLQSLGGSLFMDHQHETNYTDGDNGDDDYDDDTKSAISSITVISWIGGGDGGGGGDIAAPLSAAPLPVLPPPPPSWQQQQPKQEPPDDDVQMVDIVDCQDAVAVARQAEVNCLRIVCRRLRERVRYLELERRMQQQSPTNSSMSWLWFGTDEERIQQTLARLQHPYLRQYAATTSHYDDDDDDDDVEYAGAAAVSRTTDLEQEEESLSSLANHDDDEEDGASLLCPLP
jgi:hypothetical protein